MLEVSESKGLKIGPVSEDLPKAAAKQGWLEDPTEVRNQGFGKGDLGRASALEGLLNMFERNGVDSDFGVFGVYSYSHPAGFAAVEINPDHKLADIYIYVAPDYRRSGIGSAVLRYLLEVLYSNGIYRVECEVLKLNKGAVEFLRDQGFTWESTRKSAYWMDNNVFDVVHLRLLRSAWSKED